MIVLITVIIGIELFFTQSEAKTVYGDNPWYLTRGALILTGNYDNAFVYNSLYPVLVALVNTITRDAPTAGFIVSIASFVLLITGTAVLGRVLFSWRVGLTAALIVLFTPLNITVLTGYLNGSTLFVALIIWLAIACIFFTKTRTLQTAAFLSVVIALLITLATYTRFEGALYLIMPLITGLVVLWRARRTHTLAAVIPRIVLAGAIVSIIFIVGFVYYWHNLALGATAGSEGSGGALLTTIRQVTSRPDLLSMRVMDTIGRFTTVYPAWAWIVLAVLLIRFSDSVPVKIGLLFFTGFNALYIFILAAYPLDYYFIHFTPFFALLFAWLVLRQPSGLIACVLIMGVCTPGILALSLQWTEQTRTEPDHSLQITANALDQWITENGYADHMVYSLCPRVTPYLHSRVWLIYRLAGGYDSDQNWNSPIPLQARLHASGDLLLICDQPVYFQDWSAVLLSPDGLAGFTPLTQQNGAVLLVVR